MRMIVEVQERTQIKRLAKKKWDSQKESRHEYREPRHITKKEVGKPKEITYSELYMRQVTKEAERDESTGKPERLSLKGCAAS